MRWSRAIVGAVWVVCVCLAFAAISFIFWIDEQLQREP
jgi:hypothetical protein